MASPRNRRVLLIFAKAPVPGRVKTRLAAEVGQSRAADIYRRLGRRAVERLRNGNYRTVVYYDPPDREPELRAWLGEGGDLAYLPQPSGDLGERLIHAFEWGFSAGDLVCVVGTDIPELGRTEVEEAFSRMSSPDPVDAVFGPAVDGGYYLLGLRSPAPELFDRIPWSTDRVLRESLERARKAGLEVGLLAPLADVDRPEDLPEEPTP